MMKLFKVVSLSIKGGFLAKRKPTEPAVVLRDKAAILADYQQLLGEFNTFIASNDLQATALLHKDTFRRPTFAGFTPDGSIATFTPESKSAGTTGRWKGGVMSFSDLKERDSEKWARKEIQSVIDRAQDKALMQELEPFDARIKGLMVELGLRDAEGLGKAHDRTVIKGIDLTPKDMVGRLSDDLKRIGDTISKH